MKFGITPYTDRVVLLPDDEQARRIGRVRRLMEQEGINALIITDNANTYYLTGRVFSGYVYLPAAGEPIYFVRRPVELKGDGVVEIHKPEQMAESIGLNVPATIGLELDVTAYTTVMRLSRVFPESKVVNASGVMRRARAVKTDIELKMIEQSGIDQAYVYHEIPHLFHSGMTDIELQVEIERVSRLAGCLGQFRISGDSMELYMGNVLAGENADAPSPYDFAMGGAGLDPSLPVGANGDLIKPGTTVMIDMNGNYTGYMTDMTRTFALGEIPEHALKAHQLSIDIHRALAASAVPGAKAADLYHQAEAMVREARMTPYYMGHRQHAGFIGHGVGIEINELPVIAPRSRDVLEENMVIALEPKFVIPRVGAVGIENTYVVKADGLHPLTVAPEEIQYLPA